MRTIVIGDLHGRDCWKQIVNFEEHDRVIFVGDYFDSFDIPYDIQINNFLDLIEYKKTSGKEVVLIIGNHDIHYFPYINDTATAGYQFKYAHLISQIIDNNKDHLQIAYGFDDFLFTHSGISVEFMDNNYPKWNENTIVDDLNMLFQYKPNVFIFNGLDPYGCDTYQTPIWIRPKCLYRANKLSSLKKMYVQVFGHTQVKQIDTKGNHTGGRYYNIDTLGTSGEYMIIDENSFISFNSYKNYSK